MMPNCLISKNEVLSYLPSLKKNTPKQLIYRGVYMWLQVRTFATPDRYNQTKFSLEVAIKSMELYQDLFNVSYPLPKQGTGWWLYLFVPHF